MLLDEAKEKYKGYNVKNVGHHPDEDSQRVYKSEVNKAKHLICLFKPDGEPYLFPPQFQDIIKDVIQGGENTLPLDIKESDDGKYYIVPTKYFVPVEKTTFKVPEPIVTESVKYVYTEIPPIYTPPVYSVTTNMPITDVILSEVEKELKEVSISGLKRVFGEDLSDILWKSITDDMEEFTDNNEINLIKLISNLIRYKQVRDEEILEESK